jgi:hypothetical protein
VYLAFEPFQWDVARMIGGYLRALANTECIQGAHCAQDDEHQNEAINENHNENAKDHGFKPTCTHTAASQIAPRRDPISRSASSLLVNGGCA